MGNKINIRIYNNYNGEVMKQIGLIILCLLFTVSVSANEKSQTVKGRIIDSQSHYPIIGVTVFVVGSDPVIGNISDVEGYYKLSKVPLGRITIQFSSIGFEPITLSNILVSSGKETVIDVALKEDVIIIEPVRVESEVDKSASNNEMAAVSSRGFRVEETGRYAGSLNDVSRMAMNFAGVSGANDARNDIIIRGNSPFGLLWVLEGLSIPNPNHFGSLSSTGGPVSMLNNNVLKKSDFLTGAFPAEYGNALSGVFDLKMRNGNNEKREYMLQSGLNGFEIGLEGPISTKSKSTYLINYRYSVLGLVDKLGLDLGTGTAVPYYQDISFKFNFPSTKLGQFTLFGVGGISNIDLLTSDKDEIEDNNLYPFDDLDVRYQSKMGVVGLSHVIFLSKDAFSKTTLGISGINTENKMDTVFRSSQNEVLDIQPYYSEDETQLKYTLDNKLVKKFNAKNDISLGFTFDIYDLDLRNKSLSEFNVYQKSNFNGTTTLFQTYAQWQYRINSKLTLFPGIHYQYLFLNSSSKLEPRFGMQFKVNERQKFSIAYGRHNQMQGLNNYFRETVFSDGSVIQTNKNLYFTTSEHYVFGYDNNLSENLRLKIETYYQRISNIPTEIDSSYFSMINSGTDFYMPDKDSLVNEGTGHNIGAEITLEKFLSNSYYFLLTTSVFDSKYKGSDGIERNTVFNGNYVINGLLGKEFKMGAYNALSFDIKFTAAGNRRYIPIDLDQSRLVDTAIYKFDQSYENQYKPYFRSDFKVTYRKESSRFTQEWVLDIQNITDYKNVYLDRYDSKNNTIRTSYQMGIFPIIQYRLLF